MHFLGLGRRDRDTAFHPGEGESIVFAETPRPHRLDCVFDLAAVEIPFRELLHVCLTQPHIFVSSPALRRRRHASKEILPQLKPGCLRERGEKEVDIDAGAEGGVNGGVEVCGEEDDALKIFEFTEENFGGGVSRRFEGKRGGRMDGDDLLETSSFLTTSLGERFAMKTSASGIEVSVSDNGPGN